MFLGYREDFSLFLGPFLDRKGEGLEVGGGLICPLWGRFA